MFDATTLAKICYYAQQHVSDPQAWDHSKEHLDHIFQCTSFTIACFLANNTVEGGGGVDWDIVQEELCQMPAKSLKQWERIIKKKIKVFGGLTKKAPTAALRDSMINMVNELLANDTGVRESTYNELIHLVSLILTVDEVGLLKKHVEATDGQFYLPEGTYFDPPKA